MAMAAATVAGATGITASPASAEYKGTEEAGGTSRLPFVQGGNWINQIAGWYEFPTNDRNELEVWGYTDKLSYAPGDEVSLHVNTTASEYSLEIFRDGGTW